MFCSLVFCSGIREPIWIECSWSCVDVPIVVCSEDGSNAEGSLWNRVAVHFKISPCFSRQEGYNWIKPQSFSQHVVCVRQSVQALHGEGFRTILVIFAATQVLYNFLSNFLRNISVFGESQEDISNQTDESIVCNAEVVKFFHHDFRCQLLFWRQF